MPRGSVQTRTVGVCHSSHTAALLCHMALDPPPHPPGSQLSFPNPTNISIRIPSSNLQRHSEHQTFPLSYTSCRHFYLQALVQDIKHSPELVPGQEGGGQVT